MFVLFDAEDIDFIVDLIAEIECIVEYQWKIGNFYTAFIKAVFCI
jgi:hypothetical protein